MRFVVYGAGAIGGAIGGRLFEHGHDVVLIARGAHYQAVRDRGVRHGDPVAETTFAFPVADHPSQVDLLADDVVVLAIKTQDTHSAVRAPTETAPTEIA